MHNNTNSTDISQFWLDYGYGTVEKLTLSGADRCINMCLMKISYSQGARN